MSMSSVRLTHFQVEKLNCASGDHRGSAPFRITTYRGNRLGLLGMIGNPAQAAVNADRFDLSQWKRLQFGWNRLLDNLRFDTGR